MQIGANYAGGGSSIKTETSWLLNWDTSPILPIAEPNRPDFHTLKRMCARVCVYRGYIRIIETRTLGADCQMPLSNNARTDLSPLHKMLSASSRQVK